jgi:hypothetical protein
MGPRPRICAIALTALRWTFDPREETRIGKTFWQLRKAAAPMIVAFSRRTYDDKVD